MQTEIEDDAVNLNSQTKSIFKRSESLTNTVSLEQKFENYLAMPVLLIMCKFRDEVI